MFWMVWTLKSRLEYTSACLHNKITSNNWVECQFIRALHPYHLLRYQLLQAEDYPRPCCICIVVSSEKCAAGFQFSSSVLFSDI
ncbi:hypothetical protein NPIL_391771 [Nephila pilipes]|uniref:Uncharacterized protein n=1 Tax=Nephila pilipes TaxID=299642 RepID=A0A8X6QQW3_NEPPI|nr:hypothetical protein NPIL_391771 [Nephila pilipes]